MRRLILIIGTLAIGLYFFNSEPAIISKPKPIVFASSSKSNVEKCCAQVEKQIANQYPDLSLSQLHQMLQQIDVQLSSFTDMNYSDFSSAQLSEFNRLSKLKAVILKKYIFKKYRGLI